VINLVMNAAQALPSQDRGIFVSTRFDGPRERVILEVRDEGTGIEKALLSKILDPFFTTKRDTGGTGLGLFIAAKIVQGHGGELGFESEPGKGTLVRVTLPLNFSPGSGAGS
jgi:signal transduction histidine kinase